MKKIFLFIVCEICLFVSLLSFNFKDNNHSNYVRNINVSEKYSYDYYNEKYDLENITSNNVVFDESFTASDFNLKNTSDGDISLTLKLEIDTVTQNVDLTYLIYENGSLECKANNIYYINYENDEVVVSTSFGTTFKLNDLLEYFGILKHCASFSMVSGIDDINPFENYFGPGGGGGGGMSSAVSGAIGGALGAGLIYATGTGSSSSNAGTITVVPKKPSISSNSSSNSNVNTWGTFEDAGDSDSSLKKQIEDALKEKGVDFDYIKEILKDFLTVNSVVDFYKNKKKVLCIGRDVPYSYYDSNDMSGYQNYADKYGYCRFFSPEYDLKRKEYGEDLIKAANKLLIVYCCNNDWDFICVTHPYPYINSSGDLPHGGYSYRMELYTIRDYNYNNIDNKYNWNTLPKPISDPSTRDYWYEPASFRVMKGTR